MLSALHLSTNVDGLVLPGPLWIATLFGALAAFAIGYAIVARRRLKRPWPLFAAAIMASWASVYFATFNATLTNAFRRDNRVLRREGEGPRAARFSSDQQI